MRLLAGIAAVLFVVSCSRAVGDAAETEPRDEAQAAASVQPQAPPKVSFARSAPAQDSFAGEAARFMQTHAQPAAADLIEASSEAVRNEAKLAGCQPSAAQNQAFSVDLDADGRNEGLAIYNIICNGGRNPFRILAVLRQDEQLQWKPILQSAISVTPGAVRPIVEFRPGQIVLAGEQAMDGETMPPETIEIPAAGQTAEAVP